MVSPNPTMSPGVSEDSTAAPTTKPTSGPANTEIVPATGNREKNTVLGKPPKVTGVTLRSYSKKLSASWNFDTSNNRTGYEVQYALNKFFTKGKKAKKVGCFKTNVIIKKLRKGKIYYVRVRGINCRGGAVKYGAWSKVKKVKVK